MGRISRSDVNSRGGCGGSETAVNDIMQVLRKGVFGKSVSYLQVINYSVNE